MPISPLYETVDEIEDMKDERGFTLFELLAGMLVAALLMAVGASALRSYWLRQGLDRSSAEITTEMRGAQQRSMAESHPVVYGLRFEAGSTTWSIVQYDPRKTSNRCTEVERHEFATRVNPAAVTFAEGGAVTSECRAALGASSQFAFFFPRGTATGGTLTLSSPYSDSTQTIIVYGLTGRAEERV